MRRYLLVAWATLIMTGIAARPASAITFGVPDDDNHPYVGLVVFYDAAGTPLHRCSGTLLSPTVFLTAGHCTSGTASAQVWFDPVVTLESGYPYTGGWTGTPYTHPDFGTPLPNTNDVGIVVLDEPVVLDEYGELPELGLLDEPATRRGPDYPTFTVVGYGLQGVKPRYLADRQRYQATVSLINLRSALTDGYNIQLTNNPGEGHGPGGTSFGDSGGPVFYDNSNIIVAVNSFVLNENSKGVGFAYRIDIANSLDFIEMFLMIE